MANEILKEIKTKIALKVLTLVEWEAIKDTYKPLRGEVCFCEIPEGNANATNAPTVLFKVGDGNKFFGELNWASALAADVHAWAKAANAPDEYDTKYAFEIVKAGAEDKNEVLQVTETTYKNGVAGEPVVTTIDVVTHNDLGEALKNYYIKDEVDALLAATADAATADATAKANAAEANAKAYADEKVTALADGAVNANTEAIAAEVAAREDAVAVVERAVKTEAGRAQAAEEANAKAIADEALRAKDAENKNAGAIANEVERATGEEARIEGLVNVETAARENAIAVVERAVKTETGRAMDAEDALAARLNTIELDYLKDADKKALQEQITANATAITTLTDGIDPEKIDGLTDLVNWANEHAPEVASIKEDIEEVAEALNAYENKLGFVTTDDKTVAEVIDETFAKKAEIAAVKVDEAAHADDADTLGGNLPTYYATAQSVTDITKDNGEIDTKISAYDASKNFGDIITHNVAEFATAAQGEKADTALQSVEADTGLKIVEGTVNKVAIDTDVVFVLDCNW